MIAEGRPWRTMIELFPDITLLYQWVLFMAVLLVLNWGIFRPALKIIHERRQRTEGDERRAAEFGHKISELKAKVDHHLAQAKLEGQVLMQEIRGEAEGVATKTTQLARQRMETQLGAIRGLIETEAKAAELQLKQHTGTLAKELGERVLERPL